MKKKVVHILTNKGKALYGAKYGGKNGMTVIPLNHVEDARTEMKSSKKHSRFCCKCNKILKNISNNNSH